MAENLGDRLVVAISSRALFNLDDSHEVYVRDGLDAYSRYQIEREEEPLEPGEAFPMVQKLLRINTLLKGDNRVEVVLQPISGLGAADYAPPGELPEAAGDARAAVADLEHRVARFYDDAAEVAANVLTGLDRKFRKLAAESRKFADALETETG